MYVTLGKVKQHLNIEPSFTGDDEYLGFLIEVAERTVEAHICTNLLDLEKSEMDGSTMIQVLPKPLEHAILLYIGDLYNSREGNAYGVNVTKVPFSYDYLLSLYMNYADTTSEYFEQDVIREAVENGRFDEEGNLLIPDTDDYGLKGKATRRVRSQLRIDENGNVTI